MGNPNGGAQGATRHKGHKQRVAVANPLDGTQRWEYRQATHSVNLCLLCGGAFCVSS